MGMVCLTMQLLCYCWHDMRTGCVSDHSKSHTSLPLKGQPTSTGSLAQEGLTSGNADPKQGHLVTHSLPPGMNPHMCTPPSRVSHVQRHQKSPPELTMVCVCRSLTQGLLPRLDVPPAHGKGPRPAPGGRRPVLPLLPPERRRRRRPPRGAPPPPVPARLRQAEHVRLVQPQPPPAALPPLLHPGGARRASLFCTDGAPQQATQGLRGAGAGPTGRQGLWWVAWRGTRKREWV